MKRADIEDMFHFRYPKGLSGYKKPPAYNHDPGRIEMRSFLENFMEIVQKVLEKIWSKFLGLKEQLLFIKKLQNHYKLCR